MLHLDHQLHMLRDARPGSGAACLREYLLKRARNLPESFCTRGHRTFASSGDCYTMRELEPGLYEYVIGPCSELP
jgi:hypothetical protein